MLVGALLGRGHRLGGTVEQEYVDRLAGVRLVTDAAGAGVVVDLLLASYTGR